jgi:hypothetical protein
MTIVYILLYFWRIFYFSFSNLELGANGSLRASLGIQVATSCFFISLAYFQFLKNAIVLTIQVHGVAPLRPRDLADLARLWLNR